MCEYNESEDSKLNKLINEAIRKEKEQLNNTFKVLLLGAGESGKSTFMKQLKILHQSGYTDQERKTFKNTIQSNIISNTCNLLEAARTLKDVPPLAIENQEIAAKFQSMVQTSAFQDLAQYVKPLWKDPAIQHCIKRAAEFQLFDNAEYFFEQVDRIAAVGYLPTVDDVLRVRVKTSGIIENEAVIEGQKWCFVDVGGQRSERRKWIHCFDDVTAVIFFVSLSEYDQKCFEDNITNRMSESMKLFKDITNYKAFADNTALILFLNKKDLFKRKLSEVPLNHFFKQYTGPNEYSKACSFIRKEFVKLAPSGKDIHVYKTCATDTNNIRLIFQAVREHIITSHMIGMGFEAAPPPRSSSKDKHKQKQDDEDSD